jgi:hypothetical protein
LCGYIFFNFEAFHRAAISRMKDNRVLMEASLCEGAKRDGNPLFENSMGALLVFINLLKLKAVSINNNKLFLALSAMAAGFGF